MSDRTPKVEWLNVVGDADIWRSLGLTVTDDGLVPLIGTSIRIVAAPSDVDTSVVTRDEATSATAATGEGAPTGIVGWALSGVDGTISVGAVPGAGTHATEIIATTANMPATTSVSIDGLATEFVEPVTPVFTSHELGASGLDHVVVLTPDLERTSAAIGQATGCDLKRIREVGSMRQGFHRIGRGGLIVELVERPDLPPGPAAFWGLVLIVDDLDHACAVIGPDRISRPKDAVQPGRRIATVRGDVGLGLPLALMSN